MPPKIVEVAEFLSEANFTYGISFKIRNHLPLHGYFYVFKRNTPSDVEIIDKIRSSKKLKELECHNISNFSGLNTKIRILQ